MRMIWPNDVDTQAPRRLHARWPAGVALIDTDAADASLDDEPCGRAVFVRTAAPMTLHLLAPSRLEIRAGLPVTDPSLLADDLRAVARDLGLDDAGRKSEVRQRILNHLRGA